MTKLTLRFNDKKSVINKNIYGHFAEHLGRCIYQGFYVGTDSAIPNINGIRTDLVEALKHIRIPVLRWPGGCFADEYHWKDGIGPKENRKKMVNTHWGGVVEDNSFGTHEFMDLCAQLECEPYISANVGSGTVQEMSEWVEYLTFDGVSPMADLRREHGKEEAWRVKYWGVGNENWGCGGNMRPEFYADTYRQFQTYVRNYGENKIYKIACGPNNADYNWTEKVMEIAGRHMDALTLHYYTVDGDKWEDKGPATGFDLTGYYRTLKNTFQMETLIKNHLEIMDRHDPEHKVSLIVDEWGTWYTVEPGTNPGFLYQQNTMRDAIVAAVNLHLFNKNAHRISMTNIAQTVNVLQAVILTEGEKMLLTPTYHVYDLLKTHQNATYIPMDIPTDMIGIGEFKVPRLSTSASITEDGLLTISLANLSADESLHLEIDLGEFSGTEAQGQTLTGEMDAHNTFENPENVKLRELLVELSSGSMKVMLPPCSVSSIVIN